MFRSKDGCHRAKGDYCYNANDVLGSQKDREEGMKSHRMMVMQAGGGRQCSQCFKDGPV